MSLDCPANDQIEVSLYGPGYGESVTIHLGGGDWIVVDSCIDQDTKEPIWLIRYFLSRTKSALEKCFNLYKRPFDFGDEHQFLGGKGIDALKIAHLII